MKGSIQTKLLLICLALVVLATTSLSLAYYLLMRQNTRRISQERIAIAFEIILDDVENRSASYIRHVKEFIANESALGITASSYLKQPERLASNTFLSNYLTPTARKLSTFGHNYECDLAALYAGDAAQRLLAFYQHQDGEERTGAYVVSATGQDSFYQVQETSRMLRLVGEPDIQDTPLPSQMSSRYEGAFPEQTESHFFRRNRAVGIRIVAPVVSFEHPVGIFVVEFLYTRRIIERYAALSKTEINLFAGEQFSLGTLPAQTTLKGDPSLLCHDIPRQNAAIPVCPVSFAKQAYYQGQCTFRMKDGIPCGAFTVSLSQEFEKQKLRNVMLLMLAISGLVIMAASGLSVLLSRRIAKPIRIISSRIHRIAHGDLTSVLAGEFYARRTPRQTSRDSEASRRREEEQIGNDEIAMLAHAFYELAEYLRDMAAVANKISRGEVAQTITPRSQSDTLGISFQNMLSYIQHIRDIAKALSEGDLLVDVTPKTDKDMLSHSLRKMIMYIQGVADVAETISQGDLNVQVLPKSEQDVLNVSLQKMVAYIQEIAEIAEHVSKNNLNIAVSPHSEHDTLSLSLQQMVKNLRLSQERIEQSMQEIEQQNWLKTGQTELNDVMRGEQDPIPLAKQSITYLVQYVGARAGAFYFVDNTEDKPFLQIAASYGYERRDAGRIRMDFGQGLAGQAALERECLLYLELPEEYIIIQTETETLAPRSVLVAPLLYEDRVTGVIELASTGDLTAAHREFLNDVTENIAIALHTSRARVKMQELLATFQ